MMQDVDDTLTFLQAAGFHATAGRGAQSDTLTVRGSTPAKVCKALRQRYPYPDPLPCAVREVHRGYTLVIFRK